MLTSAEAAHVLNSSEIKGCWCTINTGEGDMQTDVREFTVRDRIGPLTFKGRMVADCRYGREDKPRWTDLALYEVTDPLGTVRPAAEIERELIRDLSREGPFQELSRSQRAALLDSIMPHVLPRIVDDQPVYRYVLEFVARSYVYHRVDGPCVRRNHHITTVGLVRASNHRWKNLFPCWKSGCTPGDLEELSPNTRIAEEKEKSHLTLCVDAHDILSRLYQRNGEISALAASLLIEAADRDPDITRALKNRRM